MFKKRMASVLSTVALSALAVGIVSPAYADGGVLIQLTYPQGMWRWNNTVATTS